MNPGFTTRARAERFAAALDASPGTTPPGTTPLGVDPAWLRVVARLEATPDVRPRPEFASALREQLMTAARTEPAAARPVDAGSAVDPRDRLRLGPGRPRGQRRLTAAVAGLALVGATGGMAVASQNALPGETLYPVKRAIEDVATGLEGDPSAKGTRLIGQARDRLTEVAALTVDDGADPVAVEQTLDDFSAQAGEAADLKLEAYYDSGSQVEVLEVRDLATDAVAALGSLEPAVPDTAVPALLRAAREAREIDSLARQACGGCGGPVVDLAPELALDAAAADLGTALGLRELRAAARPGAASGTGEGTAARDEPGRRAGGGRAQDDGRTRDAGRGGQQDQQRDRQDTQGGGGTGSLPVGGGSVPELDGPLRDLTEGVRQGLAGLTGTTPLGEVGGDLLGGSGERSADGRGDGSEKDGGRRTKDGRGGDGGDGGGDGGLIGETLEDVDDTLGAILP